MTIAGHPERGSGLHVRRQETRLRLMLNASQTKNRLRLELIRQLLDVVRDDCGEFGPEVQWISIESDSAEIFSAGADIRELARLDSRSAAAFAAQGQSLMQALESSSKPVLALVSGPCLGGALDLVLACTRVWATPSAMFQHPGVRRGLMTGFGGTVRLLERLPPRLARFMLISAHALNAEQACRWGLVERLWPSHQDMLQAAETWTGHDETRARNGPFQGV